VERGKLAPFLPGTGAGTAIGSDRRKDKAWIVLPQLVPAEANGLQLFRTVVVDQYVGPADEAAECFAAGGVVKVEANATLASIEVKKKAAPFRMGFVAGERATPSGRIAGWWVFDLDDVGPHVGEELPTVGAGDHRCVFNYSDTGKGPSNHRRVSPCG
jgi:hypothetical protein